MKISVLEEKIEGLNNSVVRQVFELIISSVRDYPLLGLDDTTIYFDKVSQLLKTEEITFELVKEHIDSISNSSDEKSVWVLTSFTSLLEALNLMRVNGISLEDIKNQILNLYQTK